MLSIHICIRHNHNFVITQSGNVKFFADTCTKSQDYWLNLVIIQNLIDSCFFSIQHFAPKRQNRLESSISSHFCRTACRISLHQKYLGLGRILNGAICKFTRQRTTFQNRFPAGQFACFTCCISRTSSQNCFHGNVFCFCRMFFKELHEFFINY